MRTVTYKCDLCRETKLHTQMLSLYYTSVIDGKPAASRFILKPIDVNECLDKQICLECIKMINEAK
jgi:hypothetical protein